MSLLTPEDGELIRAAGGAVNRVLEDGSAVGQRIGVLESRLPPGAAGPLQHVHREHDETFYVVSGVVRFQSADLTVDLSAGGFFSAPIGTPHAFANASADQPAVLLGTVSPQRYLEYFREMQRMLTGPDARLDRAAVAELMSRYATELYEA